MTHRELIELIGVAIDELDQLRSAIPYATIDRDRLEFLRDKLDRYQRQLIRSIIAENTQQFRILTVSLGKVNAELNQTIKDVNKVAQTQEALVKFVGIVQKIIEMLP